ncbi:hypothetical protein GCM10010124_35330 [Pilimelia terevasa]|uniref:Helix-turn-helix domain-containing protein n=1 Tax=Pilimelia terevasa TaxID=53372 RepID=A0A8J3BPQ5_9ACTN|nr:hypothetical protein GCM10010124_35330 [Pilimelia terevasa]
MSRTGAGGTPHTHRPAAAAKILGCSEWWLKEQARKRRIPYAWIGGSYRFTDHHLTEILGIFERRPTPAVTPTSSVRGSRSRRHTTAPVVQLVPRVPRRAQRAQQHLNQAA